MIRGFAGVPRRDYLPAHAAAVLIALLGAASLLAPPASAEPTCPNQALRTGRSGVLLDCRAWELVSPPEKGGGAVKGPGQTFGGGVLHASAAGEAATFSSTASFGADAQGAPGASQYVSRRGLAGWSTQNITLPALSGAYGDRPDGVPYQLFSPDLATGLLLGDRRCLAGEPCPRSYSLRDTDTGALAPSPAESDLRFAGASPDLRHVVLSTCVALTSDATEVLGMGGSCDPAATNLYEWGAGGLQLINTTPGAELAAQSGAVSADGSRVYFTQAGDLYLHQGVRVVRVDESAGGEGDFQTAAADGSLAFFTTEEHPGEEGLYRYDAATEISQLLSPAVKGILGASADGAYLYYQDSTGLQLWHSGATTEVAPGASAAAAGDYPPTTGTARISADGTRLAFLSKANLIGYNNTDTSTGEPDSEVYLYAAAGGGGTLTCVSCNPSSARPRGPSTIPGSNPNGTGPAATDSYKPRVLSADGERLFFDSADALLNLDSNSSRDVYEWEAGGEGTCTEHALSFQQANGGCLGLTSAGLSADSAEFIDASADGSDAFFLTADSLVPLDPGSVDLYDARQGGGFPEPPVQIACEGDSCQPLPSTPEDPTPGTQQSGPPNPAVHFPKPHHRHHHHKKHHRKRAKSGGNR